MEKTINQQIKEQLISLADEKYQRFSAALIPNIESSSVLGVRLPELRKLAKSLAKGDWKSYLKESVGRADDDFTYNKALQKITESYRIDSDTKELIRGMKRK